MPLEAVHQHLLSLHEVQYNYNTFMVNLYRARKSKKTQNNLKQRTEADILGHEKALLLENVLNKKTRQRVAPKTAAEAQAHFTQLSDAVQSNPINPNNQITQTPSITHAAHQVSEISAINEVALAPATLPKQGMPETLMHEANLINPINIIDTIDTINTAPSDTSTTTSTTTSITSSTTEATAVNIPKTDRRQLVKQVRDIFKFGTDISDLL